MSLQLIPARHQKCNSGSAEITMPRCRIYPLAATTTVGRLIGLCIVFRPTSKGLSTRALARSRSVVQNCMRLCTTASREDPSPKKMTAGAERRQSNYPLPDRNEILHKSRGPAEFTLSGAPVQTKCGALHLEKNWRPFFSHAPAASHLSVLVLLKNWRPFLLITVVVHWGIALFRYTGHAKNSPLLLWGPLFVGPLFGRTC